MKTLFIKINGITDVTTFVKMATSVEDADILVKKGKFCIDAKSLMGIFSLDLSEGVTVEYPESAKDFENYIMNFKVD